VPDDKGKNVDNFQEGVGNSIKKEEEFIKSQGFQETGGYSNVNSGANSFSETFSIKGKGCHED